MYGGCKLVYPDKTTKSTEHMHYCRHCRRHHHHHHQDSRGGEQGGHLGEVGLTEQHAERDSFYGDSYYGDSYYGNTGESADYGDAYGSYSGGYSTNYGGHGEVGGARTQEGSREFMGKTMMMFFSGGTPSSTSDTSYATTTTYSQTTDTVSSFYQTWGIGFKGNVLVQELTCLISSYYTNMTSTAFICL